MTEILSGTTLAKNIREKVRDRVKNIEHPPGLAVILVGNDPASHIYVRLKEEAAREAGIYVEKHILKTTTTKKMQALIGKLNKRNDIHGILVQLPLPEDVDTDAVTSKIEPRKDVDGFHPQNNELTPPVALAVMRLIESSRLPLRNRRAVIVCNSDVFAAPILTLLREAGVKEAQAVKKADADGSAILANADIVIVAVGEQDFLRVDMVKDSCVVIDVGTNRSHDGKVVGDASPNLIGHVGFLSKVPGGVGPLTVAYLLNNVLKARELQPAHS
jgi:methylenetetrahydrofolate dehydrogenase (NADP+)/methenyltetrahydrofolate cyclohydrolase